MVNVADGPLHEVGDLLLLPEEVIYETHDAENVFDLSALAENRQAEGDHALELPPPPPLLRE